MHTNFSKRKGLQQRALREPWFLCYAHGDAEIIKTLETMREVVKTVCW